MRTMLDRLDLKLPIWNAGMGGGIAGPELVAAVAEAGGLGVLGAGAIGGAQVRAQLAAIRALTARPCGANIILPMSDGSDVEACFDARVEVLVLFWGDPKPYVADAHKRGMFVVSQCGDAAEAVAAADAGVDAVIVQGTEAGGHVKALLPLATTVSEAARVLGPVPLIAAGGIATGSDVADALAMGATAASIGTRFLASHESRARDDYKQRVVSARASDTVFTDLFDLGWPQANHRVIRNATYDRWEQAGRPAPGLRPGEGDEIGEVGEGDARIVLPRYTVMPPVRGFSGDLDALPLYAGESVERISGVLPAAAIVHQLMTELRAAVA